MTTKQGATAETPTTQTLRFNVIELVCDPAQYKPYYPKLSPEECLVLEMEVPTDLVLDMDGGVMSVGLEGYKYILATLADAVEEMHEDRKARN